MPHFNLGKRRFRPSRVPDELRESSERELIWAAGLFEGEGSVFPERRKGTARNYVTVRMSLNTTDQDVGTRFRNIMGGRIALQKQQRPEQKPQWKWVLYGYEPAAHVFAIWEPWLGQRRKNQFVKTLSECETVRASLPR